MRVGQLPIPKPEKRNIAKILAIDLGKFKSVTWLFNTANGEYAFRTLRTAPAEFQNLFSANTPDRVPSDRRVACVKVRIHEEDFAKSIPGRLRICGRMKKKIALRCNYLLPREHDSKAIVFYDAVTPSLELN